MVKKKAPWEMAEEIADGLAGEYFTVDTTLLSTSIDGTKTYECVVRRRSSIEPEAIYRITAPCRRIAVKKARELYKKGYLSGLYSVF